MKLRLLAVLLGCPVLLTAQTLLYSLPVALKRPADRQQVLLAPDADRGLYVVASDKERVRVLKYNGAVFFRDSLSLDRPDKEYVSMAGYSIEDNAVTVFWATDSFEKLLGCRYDFTSRNVLKSQKIFDFNKETFLSAFTENGVFYVVTADDRSSLLYFYRLGPGPSERNVVDLTSFPLTDTRVKNIKWTELFQASGLQKMESQLPNPAAMATGPVKLYKTRDGFTMTVDINRRQTALFEIGNDFSVSRRDVSIPELAKAERQNSFLHENRLYQIVVSEEAMIFTCTDLETMSVIATYNATADKDISFRNSPLLAQTNDDDPNSITGSKRFLRRLSGSTVGLSVYRTPEDLLVTIGGMRAMATTGDVLLGIAAGTGIVLGGGDIGLGDMAGSSQFVFFDALFDDGFRHKDVPPMLLAADKLGQFTNEEELNAPSSTAVFRNDVLFAYHDSSKKEIIIRRFRDGSGD